MSGRPRACEKCYFGVCILLRLDELLPAVSGDISAILGTSGRICFTKDAFYNFLEVLGKKNKNKFFFPREPSRHRNGYGEGFKISHK